MQTLDQALSSLFAAAFAKAGLDPAYGEVLESQRPDLCQFQCNGALAAAKPLKARPRELAEKVLAALGTPAGLRDISLVGPGFINFSVDDAFLSAHLRSAQADPRLGLPDPTGPETVFLDFGGANVAKPLHVGHLRSAILGECLQRLHQALGNRTISDTHLGDWGTQMGMLIEAIREEQPSLPYFDPAATAFPAQSPVSLADLERLYPAMSARCKDDKALADKARQATQALQAGHPGYRALWRHFVDVSVAVIRGEMDDLKVHFDLWLGESDSQASIPAMLEDLAARGVSQSSEGATVIFMDQGPQGSMPPLLLVKSDGAYLYGTTDLATLRERASSQGARRLLYVADKRQSLHFRQVFAGAAKAGYLTGARVEHVDFGTVNGPDGKPFKTRDGGVMRLRSLLDMAVEAAGKRMLENGIASELSGPEQAALARQIGYGAIKFADLSNHRSTDYIFDLDKFTQFEGKTGPYHLYAAVRMKAILRKAAERSFAPGPLGLPSGDADRKLMLCLAAFPEALLRAGSLSTPHTLCDYAFSLAQAFSNFYQNCNILREEDPARREAWLGLTELSLRTLEKALGILGLEAPEKM